VLMLSNLFQVNVRGVTPIQVCGEQWAASTATGTKGAPMVTGTTFLDAEPNIDIVLFIYLNKGLGNEFREVESSKHMTGSTEPYSL
jgi:hypothetical protein